jgi:hypothetical protein
MNINIDCLYNLQTAMNDELAERREALENVIKNQLQAPPGLFTLSIDRSVTELNLTS